MIVLEGAEQVARYWDITLPDDKRASFRWRHLLDAPVLMLPLADPAAYVDRYAEPDKARTGLGVGADAWPAPYWTIDTSMAVMTMLLAAEDRGLGALFFGVFQREAEVRAEFEIPDGLEIIGAIALGHPRRRRRDPGGRRRGRAGHRRRSFIGGTGSRLLDPGQRLHEFVERRRRCGAHVVTTHVGLPGRATVPER